MTRKRYHTTPTTDLPRQKEDGRGKAHLDLSPSTARVVAATTATTIKTTTIRTLPRPKSNPWEKLLTTNPSIKTKTHVVQARHGHSFEVKQGAHFRIVDLHGEQVVDFMAWVLPYNNHDSSSLFAPGAKPNEHFSASYTRFALGGSAPPAVGEGLYSNRDRKMITVVADTVKTHDLLFMACNPGFYERLGLPGHRACATNVAEAMRPWGMRHWSEVVDPFNIFQNTPYYSLKALGCSRAGDYIEMRAEMDLVCAVSSCPFEGDGFNGGKVTDVAVVTEVHDADDGNDDDDENDNDDNVCAHVWF